jgi:hypothetical protein
MLLTDRRSHVINGGAFYSERAQLACASLSVRSTERAECYGISAGGLRASGVLASDSNLVVVGAGAVETDRKERREGELTAHGACSRRRGPPPAHRGAPGPDQPMLGHES